VLATFTEQVVPIHIFLYSEFPRYQEPEPCQSPSIGGERCRKGLKIQSLTSPNTI